MAVNRYLVWTVMLAALAGATNECQDKHFCKVELDPKPLGFLVPQMCCEEVQYPFTFLAHFFNNSDHNITFHLHEYYLLDVEVRLCHSAFYDMYDDYYYPADDYAVQRFCVDDYPYRCLTEREALAASVLSYRSWDESGYLNITIPVKPRPVLQTHGHFNKRPVFNITYERRRLGEPGRIADEGNIANLDMCNFNGYPVLTSDANGKSLVFKCQCNDDAEGDKCEWGGGCQPHVLSSQCSGHGECRYYRGSIKCICDENHFGYRCEHPLSSAQPLQPSVCRELKLECSHLCTLAGHPHCLCPPHLVLHNKTHCAPRAQLVNVTVRLLEDHHDHTFADQATKILEDACISVMDVIYRNDSKEFHFTMNEKQQDFLPDLSDWRASLNSSVTINITKQDIIWLGPFNKTVREGRLMLQCTVFAASFPLNVSWFIGQDQIYTLEVDSCEGYKVDKVIAVEFIKQSHTTCHNDTRCMYDTRPCLSDTSCTIKLTADKYNPDLDWGGFSIEVRHGNTSARQTVVVDANPRAVVMVTPLSASLYKNDTTTLSCTISGDWKWNEDCEIKWVFPMNSGVFSVETPLWNVSHLYIKHLNQSISVTCEVTLWGFCDDRRSRNQRVCVAPGCKPQVVAVYYLEPGMLVCPAQMDGTVYWHNTPVGKTIYSNCPEGFEGISRRECKPNYNKTAVWAEADYYRCVYQPFYNLIQRTPMRYLKRGYHVAMDPNSTMEEMRLLFGAREGMLNPWEHSLIQEQVKYLFWLSTPPVDPQVFLGLLHEVRKRTAVNDTWQLEPLMRMYLNLETGVRGPHALHNLSLWRADIPAQQEMANITIEYPEGRPRKRLRLKVVMPQGDRKMVRVGAFVFLDPKRIPPGMVHNTNPNNGLVLDHTLSGPVVEVVVMVPTKGNVTAFTENFTLNLSYYDPSITTDRNEKCGGAEVPTSVGEPVLWNLGRCNTLGQSHRGRRAVRCHCRGPGLFAIIKVPEIQTAESALKRPLMVALTCCGIVLVLVVVLCILWLSSVPPVLAIRRRFLLGRCDASSMLLSHLKRRLTPYVPCFAANLENNTDLNDAGVTYELHESQPSCYLGSSRHINVRRRAMETCLDTVDPSQQRLITVHRCQGSPLDTRGKCKNYLDMDQLTLANHMYENILGLSEAEQVQRWGSYFLLENEYLDPDGIQLLPFVNDSKSDPDESQS